VSHPARRRLPAAPASCPSCAAARLLLGVTLALALGSVGAAAGEWISYLYMNDIRDLTVTADGVWCATGGGALFYDFTRSDFRAWNRGAEGPASDTLSAVAALDDGRIAFGTDAAGVSVYDPVSGLWFDYSALTWPIASNEVRFLREAPPWRLIGSRGGFVALRDGEVREACQQGLDICGLAGWDVTAGIEYDDALWFGSWPGEGSRGGMARFRYATTGIWDTVNVGLPSNQIVELAAWNDSLYCATSQGIVVWTGDQWVARSAGLPAGGAVTDLYAGPTRLLATKSGPIAGVFAWDAPTATWLRLGPDSLNLQAYCVAEDQDGIVWAGMSPLKSGLGWLEPEQDGLWEFVGGTWIQHRRAGPHPIPTYRALTIDAQGRLWAATSASQRGWRIARFAGGDWSFFNSENTDLSDAWVFDLRVDGDRAWVGHCCCSQTTQPCRMNVWEIGGTEVAVHDSVFNVFDSAVDGRGNFWFASWYEGSSPVAMGVYHLDRATETWSNYTSASTGGLLLSDKVIAVACESNRLWIGYQNEGVTRVTLDASGRLPSSTPSAWTSYSSDDPAQPLPSDGVRALAAREEEVWIGTIAGVSRWRPGDDWRVYHPSPWGLPGSEVTDIAVTPENTTWVAIRGAGVTRIATQGGSEVFEQFMPPEIVNPDVTVLGTAPGGREVWVGTEQGLSRYIPGAEASAEAPQEVHVYPNPYNPACAAPLRLASLPGRAAEGVIVDVAGAVVGRFEDAWSGDAIWDGRDREGAPVAPGLYLVRAATPRGWLTGRIAVLDLPCE